MKIHKYLNEKYKYHSYGTFWTCCKLLMETEIDDHRVTDNWADVTCKSCLKYKKEGNA